MVDLFIHEMHEPAVRKLNKQQMCDIINQIDGHSMTPDVWTKKELMVFLIEGGAYDSWLRQ
tara:strand:- start:182 stop:364 length:183 start_codon:yes stop_codon:yes gene_type:complete